MRKAHNLLWNCTKQSVNFWARSAYATPNLLKNCGQLAFVRGEHVFSLAKFLELRAQLDKEQKRKQLKEFDDRNMVMQDVDVTTPDYTKQTTLNLSAVLHGEMDKPKWTDYKRKPMPVLANETEPLDLSKADWEEILKTHKAKMDELISQMHEHIKEYREFKKQQELEQRESKLEKVSDVKRTVVLNFGNIRKLDLDVMRKRHRKLNIRILVKRMGDQKTLSDQMVRLTKELETEKHINKQQYDKYKSLLQIFAATRSHLAALIAEEKTKGTKNVFIALLSVWDALQALNYSLSPQNTHGISQQLQHMQNSMKSANAALYDIFNRYKVSETHAIQKPFDSHSANEKIDETLPPNAIVSVPKEG